MIRISFLESEIPDIEAPNLTVALMELREALGALNVWSILFREDLTVTMKYELVREEEEEGGKHDKEQMDR